MENISILTNEGFAAMEQSVADECKDRPDETGVVVALWRLRALLKGYRFAVDAGYNPGAVVSEERYEERETGP